MDGACNLCGGTAGTFSPHGNHYLCEALSDQGLPTPCLGMKCPDCNGNGHTSNMASGRSLWLGFDMGPRQISKTLALAFPTCTKCNGTGAVKA